MEPHVAAQRSALMARVRQKNTKPEMIVRRWLHREGFRFRLHKEDLPGRPDIVLPKYRSVIFVHGCFWHRHEGCKKATTPKTRFEFWREKFEKNQARDKNNIEKIKELGWNVAVIWECETSNEKTMSKHLSDFLQTEPDQKYPSIT